MRYLVSFVAIFVIIYATELREQGINDSSDYIVSMVTTLILTPVFYIPLAICIWLDELRARKK